MIASNPTENLRRPYETVVTPEQVPLYELVPVHGPQGEPLGAYRGVRRKDTSQVASIVSQRYQLVQHREVAEAVHAIGEALEQPNLDSSAPAFPREEVRLSSATDLMAMLQKAIHTILGRFRDALSIYADAMGEEVLAENVESALVAAGLPRVYASTIGARA